MKVFVLALLAAGLVAAGCGGGSTETAAGDKGKETAEQRPPAGSADAEKRRVCLEARESVGIGFGIRNECREVGVTQGSPPSSSSEAQEAAKKAAGDPANLRVRRSTALQYLDEGNRSGAKRELEKGCPKSDPEELSEAWQGLQQVLELLRANPEMSFGKLVERLDELCLL